jgi:hypothetical protein
MNNYFLEAEKEGRQKIMYLFSDNTFVESEDAFAVWDFSGCTSNPLKPDKNYFIETKDRKFNHNQYDSVLLEYEKLKNLLKVAKQNDDADIFYINTYQDDVALIFNLKKFNLTEVNICVKKIQKTTMGNTTAVDKLIVELPISRAIKRNIH